MKAWLCVAVLAASALAPAPRRDGGLYSETRPSQDPRLLEAQARLDKIRGVAAKLQASEPVALDALEAEFPLPGRDADQRTRDLRDEVLTLEEEWVAARAARAIAIDNFASERALPDLGFPEEGAPTPHSLAQTQAVPLAIVRMRRGRYEKALETLRTAEGAEARYLEARCLDALDRVDDALPLYKKARELAAGDAALTSSIERASRALDWKIKFGRPDDILDPIRKSKFTGFQALQKPADVKDGGSVKQAKPEESNAASKH
jgi:tetratricopeptide (TPR) repeat protein